jgi:hypothetical protein
MAKDKEGKEIVESGIPKQVLENAQIAEDLIEKLNTPETPPAVEEPVDPDAEVPAVVEEPVVPAAEEGDTVPPVKVVEPEVTDWEAEFQKLDQKHKTLQGKYNAEAPGENSRADKLQNELTAFKATTIEKLKALTTPEVPVIEEPSADMVARKGRIEKMLAEYGGEYMDDLDAFVADRVDAGIAAGLAPIQEKLTAHEEKQVAVVQDKFMTTVEEKITVKTWEKDWTEQGSNPEFEEFLKQPDPSGLYTNGQLAEMFSDKGDADKFSTLLNIFYQTQGDPTPAADPTPAVVPVPAKETPRPDAMVAPSRTAPATTPADAGDKIIWTQSTMDAFYKKDQKKGYTPEESAKLWEDILLAPHEGRIAVH